MILISFVVRTVRPCHFSYFLSFPNNRSMRTPRSIRMSTLHLPFTVRSFGGPCIFVGGRRNGSSWGHGRDHGESSLLEALKATHRRASLWRPPRDRRRYRGGRDSGAACRAYAGPHAEAGQQRLGGGGTQRVHWCGGLAEPTAGLLVLHLLNLQQNKEIVARVLVYRRVAKQTDTTPTRWTEVEYSRTSGQLGHSPSQTHCFNNLGWAIPIPLWCKIEGSKV